MQYAEPKLQTLLQRLPSKQSVTKHRFRERAQRVVADLHTAPRTRARSKRLQRGKQTVCLEGVAAEFVASALYTALHTYFSFLSVLYTHST